MSIKQAKLCAPSAKALITHIKAFKIVIWIVSYEIYMHEILNTNKHEQEKILIG